MANSTFPDNFVGAGDGIINLNVDSRPHSLQFNLNVDPSPLSPQSTEFGFGRIDLMEQINLNVDHRSPSPHSAESGSINLNVDHGFPSPQFTELEFDGIIYLEELDGIIDLNAEPSDADFNEFFVGQRGSVSESIDLFDSDSDSEEQIIVIGDERESDEEASDRMQEDVALPSCLDSFELFMREDRQSEEIDAHIDEMELDGERDEVEEVVDLNRELEGLLWVDNLGRNSMDVEAYFVDDDREGVADEYDEPYDVLPSWQFADDDEVTFNGNPLSPPSMANSVAESLPAVSLSQEEITEHNVYSTEGIDLGWHETERFPFSHQYQEGIVLRLPVCNRCASRGHELPMDDLEYEQSREQRGW